MVGYSFFFRTFGGRNRINGMKKFLCLVALAGLMAGLTACGNKKKSEDIIAQKVVKVKPKAPIKMQEYTDDRDVKWVEGRTYHVAVHRQPCDTLAMVKDETGQKFVDNVFTVTVSRSDGSVFFNRKFTKSSFAQYINADYRKTGILEGIVFDKADGDWLVFGASVGHPQTDEYIPLVIKLSRMGVLQVAQDTQMDTASTQEGTPQSENDDDGV